MDTGTHLVFGLGLAGLAMTDPVVASNPPLFGAVLAGTIIGSQAPDLDGLLRLKSNALYIRNHRGISHSLPAVLIWTVLITAPLLGRITEQFHGCIWGAGSCSPLPSMYSPTASTRMELKPPGHSLPSGFRGISSTFSIPLFLPATPRRCFCGLSAPCSRKFCSLLSTLY